MQPRLEIKQSLVRFSTMKKHLNRLSTLEWWILLTSWPPRCKPPGRWRCGRGWRDRRERRSDRPGPRVEANQCRNLSSFGDERALSEQEKLTQPGKVDCYPLAKVFSYVVKGLVLVPLTPPTTFHVICGFCNLTKSRTRKKAWNLLFLFNQVMKNETFCDLAQNW